MSAKYIIKSEDRTKKGVSSAKKNLRSLGKNFEQAGNAGSKSFGGLSKIFLGKVGLVFAVAKLGKSIQQFGKEATRVFRENERVMLRYNQAIESSNADLGKMNNFVSEISKSTLTAATDVQHLTGRLLSLGRTETETQEILEASVAMSNATGEKLETVVRNVNKTFSGTASRLERDYLPQLRNLTEEQLRSGKAVEVIQEHFNDFTDTMDDSSSQTLKNFDDTIDTLYQNIGSLITDRFDPLLQWLTRAGDTINEMMETNAERQERIDKRSDLIANLTGNQEELSRNGNEMSVQEIHEGLADASAGDLNFMAETITGMIIHLSSRVDGAFGVGKEMLQEDIQQLEDTLELVVEKRGTYNERLANREEEERRKSNNEFLEQMQLLISNQTERNDVVQDMTDEGATPAEIEFELFQRGLEEEVEFQMEDMARLLELGNQEMLNKVLDLQNWELDTGDGGNDFQKNMEELYQSSIEQQNILSEMKDATENEIKQAWLREGLGDKEVNISSDDLGKLLQSEDEAMKQMGEHFLQLQYANEKEKEEDGKEYSNINFLEQTTDAVNDGISNMFGEGGGVLSGILQDMLGGKVSMLASIGPLVALLEVGKTILEGVLQVIEPILTMTLEPVVGMLRVLGQMIGEILIPVFEALNGILTPVLELIKMLFDTILRPIVDLLSGALTTILEPLVLILSVLVSVFQMLEPILTIIIIPPLKALSLAIKVLMIPINLLSKVVFGIGKIFQAIFNNVVIPVLNGIMKGLAALYNAGLSPAIEVIANGFIWFYNSVILPVGNSIAKFFGTIFAGIVNIIRSVIATLNKIPGLDISKPEEFDPSSLEGAKAEEFKSGSFDVEAVEFEGVNIGGQNKDIDDFYEAGGNTYGGGGAGGSGGTAAQYTGGKDIKVNVEINTSVLTGDNGFDELAIRLRDSIERQVELGY